MIKRFICLPFYLIVLQLSCKHEPEWVTAPNSLSAGLDTLMTQQYRQFCIGSDVLPFDLSQFYSTATTTNGIWTIVGPYGVAHTIDGTLFNPAEPGSYRLTYSVTDGEYLDSDSCIVEVFPYINAHITSISVCLSPSGTINLAAMMINNNTTPGGVWTATGVNATVASISNDVLTYTIPSGSLGPYSINISYTLTGLPGAPEICKVVTDTAAITIEPPIDLGFNPPSVWYAVNGDIDLVDYTTVGGGTWYLLSQNGVPSVPATGVLIPDGVVTVGNLNYVGGVSELEIRYQRNGICSTPATKYISINL